MKCKTENWTLFINVICLNLTVFIHITIFIQISFTIAAKSHGISPNCPILILKKGKCSGKYPLIDYDHKNSLKGKTKNSTFSVSGQADLLSENYQIIGRKVLITVDKARVRNVQILYRLHSCMQVN